MSIYVIIINLPGVTERSPKNKIYIHVIGQPKPKIHASGKPCQKCKIPVSCTGRQQARRSRHDPAAPRKVPPSLHHHLVRVGRGHELDTGDRASREGQEHRKTWKNMRNSFC